MRPATDPAHVVVDASSLVDFLLRPQPQSSLAVLMERGRGELHTPALCDVEVLAALRRGVERNRVPLNTAEEALADLADLPLNRWEHGVILRRAFGLRHNFTAYDATYVALAEALGATLLTADLRLARAVRTHTAVDVMEPASRNG